MMPNHHRLLTSTPIAFVTLCIVLLFTASLVAAQSPARRNSVSSPAIPRYIILRILRAEDDRRWDDDLRSLLTHNSSTVRIRAALAAGRIGNDSAVADLVRLLKNDRVPDVRAMAAFALGEIESPLAASDLVQVVNHRGPLRARAIEALGKIAAALPREQEARQKELAKSILEELSSEHRSRAAPEDLTVLLGLTAVLRSRPTNAGPLVAEFLTYSNPRIRANAANTLARLRLNDGNAELRKLLTSSDPDVRANAARVLGATEDKTAFNSLLDRAVSDPDSRVRVSAIRALASLKGASATARLIERGDVLLASATARTKKTPRGVPVEANELLEIASTLGRLRQNTNDERTVRWLRQLRPVIGAAPEVEIALARIYPKSYPAQLGAGLPARERVQEVLLMDWRAASSVAQGLGELATLPDTTSDNKGVRENAADLLRAMLDYQNSDISVKTVAPVHSEYAIPDVLRAFAAFKPKDLRKVLGSHLAHRDVIIRGTAAELLGELPPEESITSALVEALPVSLRDKELNDAALAILDVLGKQKNAKANDAIKSALDSQDHLIRRRAVSLLKANAVGDFSSRIAVVKSGNTTADYDRAISRIGTTVNAVVSTTKGSFTIQLLPEEAPLTVDNFIQLASRNYFRGITVHRVVPNFVIQDGDPRGDGNGGPGYQIRCEINQAPYGRGAVGMALSGKDTGGSQWFVTHAPQPHLDGGYTVFGNVIAGMDVVDSIVRGDVIQSIVISERGGSRRRSQ
jgi:cyclophilin family peptidyl-prolyl cis-trans isomerase/HEAT repeat protein